MHVLPSVAIPVVWQLLRTICTGEGEEFTAGNMQEGV